MKIIKFSKTYMNVVIEVDDELHIITSNLHVETPSIIEDPYDDDLYNAAIDGLESLILAHSCEGIDILDQRYINGIVTTIDAIAQEFGDD